MTLVNAVSNVVVVPVLFGNKPGKFDSGVHVASRPANCRLSAVVPLPPFAGNAARQAPIRLDVFRFTAGPPAPVTAAEVFAIGMDVC